MARHLINKKIDTSVNSEYFYFTVNKNFYILLIIHTIVSHLISDSMCIPVVDINIKFSTLNQKLFACLNKKEINTVRKEAVKYCRETII